MRNNYLINISNKILIYLLLILIVFVFNSPIIHSQKNPQETEFNTLLQNVNDQPNMADKILQLAKANEYAMKSLTGLDLFNACYKTSSMAHVFKANQLTQDIISSYISNENKLSPNSNEYKLYFILAEACLNQNKNNESIAYFKKVLEYTENANSALFKGETYNGMGKAYFSLGEYIAALDCFDKAIDVAVVNVNEPLRIKAMANKGMVYTQFANYPKALESNHEVYELSLKNNDKNLQALSLCQIGQVYSQINQTANALDAFSQAQELFKELGDSIGLTNSLILIGKTYLHINNLSESLSAFQQSLQYARSNNQSSEYASILTHLGIIYLKKSDYNQALRYQQMALDCLQTMPDKSVEARIQGALGDIYLTIGNYQEAETSYNKSIGLAYSIGELELLATSVNGLANLAQKTGNYQQALLLKNRYATLKDSILNDKTLEYIARMDAVYRSVQKESIIKGLLSEKRAQAQDLKGEKIIRYIFIVLIITLLILAIVLYLLFRVKNKSQQLLSKSNKELEQLNATKDKLFSVISHDLRSPLNSILGFSEMMSLYAESNNTEQLIQSSQQVYSSSRKLLALVDNLLLWSRSQIGSTRYNPQKLDLAIQCNNIISLMRAQAEDKDVVISANIRSGLVAWADVNLFDIVFRNILNNALKYSRLGGTILISAIEKKDQIQITVHDNGVGIPKDRIDKLFIADSEYTTQGTLNEKGSGLGLAICKEYVEKNKGAIWAESELNKYTSFHFTLPLHKE